MKHINISPEKLDQMAEEGRRYVESRRAEGPDPNSALIWFPAARDAGIRVPRTEFVEFHPDMLWPALDGKPIRDDFPLEALKSACERIGYPVFIRTDLSSAKHDGPNSFRAISQADLMRCVYNTFEDNACKDLASFVRCWMVREWIDIDASFTAFGGLKIGKEWRFFATADKVACHHFYWPEEAFRDGFGVSREGWQQALSLLSSPLTAEQEENLSKIAVTAVRAIGEGEWSVDFAFDTKARPWLIDMARASSSWHPSHAE